MYALTRNYKVIELLFHGSFVLHHTTPTHTDTLPTSLLPSLCQGSHTCVNAYLCAVGWGGGGRVREMIYTLGCILGMGGTWLRGGVYVVMGARAIRLNRSCSGRPCTVRIPCFPFLLACLLE